PDIIGESGAEKMRRLLSAYEILSDQNRRFEYDRAYNRFAGKYSGNKGFDYRSFLKNRKDDPESQSKLIFFELLHMEEDAAISVWDEQGGNDFPMEKYLDREDWMDLSFMLAEELSKRNRHYEAFQLLIKIVREERRRPYFRHFMPEVEAFLKELVRLRLRRVVDGETYVVCLETLLELGFPRHDEERWKRSMKDAISHLAELESL
ncbi:MAG: J domain-containing protein, partial [Treponema sp.]|nr:J domain-containing protein [Treponema sp.]